MRGLTGNIGRGDTEFYESEIVMKIRYYVAKTTTKTSDSIPAHFIEAFGQFSP